MYITAIKSLKFAEIYSFCYNFLHILSPPPPPKKKVN